MATKKITVQGLELTQLGADTMKAVGLGQLSFFDEGIVEHSGIWGECLVSELGHKSSGTINRLRDLGLWYFTPEDQQDENKSGGWWALTALGAAVANELAGNVAEEAPAPQPEPRINFSDFHAEDCGCPDCQPAQEAPAEEAPAEEAPALPLSKTSVYAQLKAIREALREAERAIERGDTRIAFMGLGLAANRATDLDRDARDLGINGL